MKLFVKHTVISHLVRPGFWLWIFSSSSWASPNMIYNLILTLKLENSRIYPIAKAVVYFEYTTRTKTSKKRASLLTSDHCASSVHSLTVNKNVLVCDEEKDRMSSSKSLCEWNSSLDYFDNFRDNVFFVPVYRKEALRGTVCSVREVVRESSNSPRFISQLVLFANGFQLSCCHNLSLCAQINNKRKKVWISRLYKFYRWTDIF